MDTKKPWLSKTIWINAILGAASIAAIFMPAASGVPAWLAANAPLVGSIWAGLGIVLRLVSKDKISLGE